MNLTFHLVRKDLVRMRLWIACWVLLLLTPIVLGAWLIGNSPFTEREWYLADAIFIITGVELLVGYLLTILVIHEDGLVGTQQFWSTRPICRGRLLTAKALGVLIIVGLVPVIVSVPWWWWCGFGVGQMARAAGEMLILLLLAVLPGAVVAALTDSFARALLWSFAAVALVMFSGFFFTVAHVATALGDNRDLPFLLARAEFAVAAVAAELMGVVAALFLVRGRRGWLAAAGGLIAMTIVVAARWTPLDASAEPREHDTGRGDSVRVQFQQAMAGPKPQDAAKKTGTMKYQRVTSQLVVTGLPQDRSLLGLAAKQRWTWPNGTTVERFEPLFFSSDVGPRSLLGLKIYPDGQEEPEENLLEAWLPASIVARMQTEPPKFEARLWWEVIRPELQLEVPLKPGRWVTRNGYGVGIDRLDTRDDAFNIVMVATRPVLLWPLLRASGEWYRRFELDYQQSWALLNRERGRVSYVFGELHGDKPRWIVVYGVKVEWRMHFWTGARTRVAYPARDPNRVPATSLAIITMREDAILSREVKVDRFLPGN
jgi:hypothetical protein